MFFIGVGIIVSCSKDGHNPIPYARVSFVAYPDAIDNIAIGDCRIFNYAYGRGLRGVVIFRFSLTDFKIYESACPHDFTDPQAIVQKVKGEPFVVCPVCKTKYNLLDGSVVSGVSKYGLLEYHYSYDPQTGVLNVYN